MGIKADSRPERDSRYLGSFPCNQAQTSRSQVRGNPSRTPNCAGTPSISGLIVTPKGYLEEWEDAGPSPGFLAVYPRYPWGSLFGVSVRVHRPTPPLLPKASLNRGPSQQRALWALWKPTWPSTRSLRRRRSGFSIGAIRPLRVNSPCCAGRYYVALRAFVPRLIS